MNWHGIIKQSEKVIVDNAPTILTAIGVVGTFATAYFTGKASLKAADDIREEKLMKLSTRTTGKDVVGEKEFNEVLSRTEQVQLVWKLYLPAAGVAVVTVSSIILANRIGMKRAATLAAALTLSEKAYSEYKEKTAETIGKNKERKIRDDIAQDRVNNTPASGQQIIITGGGEVLCFDMYTGRYFKSSAGRLERAVNELNHELTTQGGTASLTDFYCKINVPKVKLSDDVGWNSDDLIELNLTTTMSHDEKSEYYMQPCLAVDFLRPPAPDYFRGR